MSIGDPDHHSIEFLDRGFRLLSYSARQGDGDHIVEGVGDVDRHLFTHLLWGVAYVDLVAPRQEHNLVEPGSIGGGSPTM